MRCLNPEISLSFNSKISLYKIQGACKIVTAADLKRRLEALECGPGAQETKIFFIDAGSDQALTQAQWEAVKAWEQAHPWGQAHVIVFEEVGPG